MAAINPLLTKINIAADIQTLDTSGDADKVKKYKLNAAKLAERMSKKVRVKAKESGDDKITVVVNKPLTYYSTATKNLMYIRITQLVNVLRANVDGLFKDLILLTDIDSLAAAGKLYDDNKNLVSSNRKHKKVNGTDALEKLKPQAVKLLNDIRTICEGNLEPDSSVLNGLLLASEIPEFGIRHTNADVLVVKEGNVSLGKKVVATDLTSTSKKNKPYKSNADSVVAITEHMPGKALIRFEAEGCEAQEVEITFEKGKTVEVTVVLKGV